MSVSSEARKFMENVSEQKETTDKSEQVKQNVEEKENVEDAVRNMKELFSKSC